MKFSETLPHEGEYRSAPDKKHAPTIVFVHQYGGRKESVRAHQDFVSELGFDSVTFNLSLRDLKSLTQRLPITHELKIGIVPVWTEEIHQILSALPGPKILYSFSFPSAAALAVVRERCTTDVVAWVCDGGPFLQAWRVFWNYLAVISGLNNPFLRAAISSLAFAVFQIPKVNRSIHENFAAIRPGFPILSVRYWQDRLVPMPALDQAFVGSDQTALEILSLPEGGHIQGLTESPHEYRPRLTQFLARVSGQKEFL
jgi:hypothetical protein